jgi:hypothetical protein
MKKLGLTVVGFLLLTGSGCNSNQTPSNWTGQYQGFVYLGGNTGSSGEGIEISGNATVDGSQNVTLIITAVQDPTQASVSSWTSTIQVQPSDNQTIQVTSSTDDFATANLSYNSSSSCFESQPTSPPQAPQNSMRVCANDDQVSMLVADPNTNQLFKLQLSRFNPSTVLPFEQPAAYTIGQLIDRAKTKNFDTVIEFQRVIAARDTAINAHMNLLPHFNTTDVLNVASLSALTVLKSIGDLVPFLLPTQWARAKEATDQSNAELNAWRTIDADGMNITEGLALSSVRDSLAIARLKAEEDSVNSVKDLVLAEEQSGLLQVGSSDDIAAIANSLENGVVLLQALLTNELASLSSAAGFVNPQAISSVTFGIALTNFGYDLDQPPTVDLTDWTNLVTARSPEMLQMNALLQMAQTAKSVTYFNWLDPSGSAQGGMGFGLPSYIAISKDQIGEIQAQMNKVQAGLISEISEVSTDLNQTLQSYQLTCDAVDINDQRVQRLTDNFRLGIQVTMSDLVSALQDQEKSDLDLIDYEFGFYAAVSRMNRLLYTGPYSDIPFEKN